MLLTWTRRLPCVQFGFKSNKLDRMAEETTEKFELIALPIDTKGLEMLKLIGTLKSQMLAATGIPKEILEGMKQRDP